MATCRHKQEDGYEAGAKGEWDMLAPLSVSPLKAYASCATVSTIQLIKMTLVSEPYGNQQVLGI